MKRVVFLICITTILISLYSCKKDNNVTSISVVGTWELENAQRGMIPLVDYPSGNGNILVFTNSTFKKYAGGNIIESGSYTIVKDTSVIKESGLQIPAGQFTNRIIFNNDTVSSKTFIEIANNKLELLSGYFPLDGGSSASYKRN